MQLTRGSLAQLVLVEHRLGHRHAVAQLRSELARRSPERRVELESHRLLALWKRLQAASPQSVLNRGFAIVRDAEGTPVMRRAALPARGEVQVEFADGTARLKRSRSATPGEARPQGPALQGEGEVRL